MSYRFLPHTADVRIEISAADFAGLVGDCVAMVRELVSGDSDVSDVERREVAAPRNQPDEIVFHLVRGLLEAFYVDAFVPARLEEFVSRPGRWVAVVRGEPFNPARHTTQPEVKAITRHGLAVTQTRDGWRAEILFDV